MQPFDGIPLQFRDAVAHADNAGAQLADAQEIGQARHETLVDGRHQLQDVARAQTGTGKGFLLVESESLQVFLGTGEGDRLTERPRRGYVIDNLFPGAAQEVPVVQLQVLLLRERKTGQVFQITDRIHVHAVFTE